MPVAGDVSCRSIPQKRSSSVTGLASARTDGGASAAGAPPNVNPQLCAVDTASAAADTEARRSTRLRRGGGAGVVAEQDHTNSPICWGDLSSTEVARMRRILVLHTPEANADLRTWIQREGYKDEPGGVHEECWPTFQKNELYVALWRRFGPEWDMFVSTAENSLM